MRVKTEAVMIMGCSSKVAKNGNTYYNVDVYDSVAGELYQCGAEIDVFNKLMAVQKPAQVKSLSIDIGKPYNGASRLYVVGWE